MLKRSFLALPLGFLCFAAPPATDWPWVYAYQSVLKMPAKDLTVKAVKYYAPRTPWNVMVSVVRENGNGVGLLKKPGDQLKLKAGATYRLNYHYDKYAALNAQGRIEGFGQVQFVDGKGEAVTLVIHLTPESHSKVDLDLDHGLTDEGVDARKKIVTLQPDARNVLSEIRFQDAKAQ